MLWKGPTLASSYNGGCEAVQSWPIESHPLATVSASGMVAWTILAMRSEEKLRWGFWGRSFLSLLRAFPDWFSLFLDGNKEACSPGVAGSHITAPRRSWPWAETDVREGRTRRQRKWGPYGCWWADKSTWQSSLPLHFSAVGASKSSLTFKSELGFLCLQLKGPLFNLNSTNKRTLDIFSSIYTYGSKSTKQGLKAYIFDPWCGWLLDGRKGAQRNRSRGGRQFSIYGALSARQVLF